jgi:hypothetical protein
MSSSFVVVLAVGGESRIKPCRAGRQSEDNERGTQKWGQCSFDSAGPQAVSPNVLGGPHSFGVSGRLEGSGPPTTPPAESNQGQSCPWQTFEPGRFPHPRAHKRRRPRCRRTTRLDRNCVAPRPRHQKAGDASRGPRHRSPRRSQSGQGHTPLRPFSQSQSPRTELTKPRRSRSPTVESCSRLPFSNTHDLACCVAHHNRDVVFDVVVDGPDHDIGFISKAETWPVPVKAPVPA